MTTNRSINYAILSNKDIVKLDNNLYDKHCEFWKYYPYCNDPNEIEIPYEQIACMIPGDISTIHSGRFLLEKITGGALKQILKKDEFSMKKYKHFMIIHQSLSPMFLHRLKQKIYLYDMEKSHIRFLGNYKDAIYPTRYILEKGFGDIQHHEYFLVFHNEKSILNHLNEIEPLIQCLIENSTRHYIYFPPRENDLTLSLLDSMNEEHEDIISASAFDKKTYVPDIDDLILEAYFKCIIFINILFVIYYATMILV